ncbi:MAG: type II toxin-antitoxin system VapC family toxin [Spirochaetota bacterium]|nr:type II toxin-antitoxin system VapC family toxin [Spirochaetota bacterium]
MFLDTCFLIDIMRELKKGIEDPAIMIPQMDLLIGCQAKMLNMPIVTKDVDHFNRIKGLVVESY